MPCPFQGNMGVAFPTRPVYRPPVGPKGYLPADSDSFLSRGEYIVLQFPVTIAKVPLAVLGFY